MTVFYKIVTYIILVALPFAVAAPAIAGSVFIEQWRGHSVVRMSGEISGGLADQLSEIIEEASVWADGTRVLLLDSPGGSVNEAFRVSDVLQNYAVRTVVPNGASCASACASIVFVAGQYRTVEPFGRIGQHSCSRGGLPDQKCNDEIANHAVQNGVSYGSIAAFVTFALPSEIIWFSREDVDGWGLSRYPGEEASRFQKSEPRVFRMLFGEMPAAQSAWRLDFHGDGYRAFVRTVSDAEREMQINLFCYETLPGRLFLSMEIYGNVEVIRNAISLVTVATENFSWNTERPLTFQEDPAVTSVVMEIPGDLIRPFLVSSDQLLFRVDLREPFQPIQATTYLTESRANLLFAANNCSRAEYDLDGSQLPPLH